MRAADTQTVYLTSSTATGTCRVDSTWCDVLTALYCFIILFCVCLFFYVILNGDGGCRLWQPVQADSEPKLFDLVLGRQSLGAVLHSSNEPGELSQWLCHDDSTMNIVLDIIIIYFYMQFSSYYIWLPSGVINDAKRWMLRTRHLQLSHLPHGGVWHASHLPQRFLRYFDDTLRRASSSTSGSNLTGLDRRRFFAPVVEPSESLSWPWLVLDSFATWWCVSTAELSSSESAVEPGH